MAIANDWHVDYNNKLIVHATLSIAYDNLLVSTFIVGEEVTTDINGDSAVVVKDSGTVLDLVYVVGAWTENEAFTGTDSGATADVDATITTKTDTYTVRNLYTHVQDTFDELVAMDDTVAMSAQTPTAFTMINGWFIDEESTQYLTEGSIATSGWDATNPTGNADASEF